MLINCNVHFLFIFFQYYHYSMTVPLLDLQAQYRALKPALDAALIRVAESQVCILGSEVDALERTMAEYCGVRFALGVSSGTDALLMALMALNIGAGDEVIVPTFSFFATAGAVARVGATPVFVDSEPNGFNLNPDLLESLITPRTKAIIPVHLFGQCAAMDDIVRIANKHGLAVIEDAAQAIGTEYKDGRTAGSIGQMGCFSFYPTKNLGAFGDAGLVTTNDEALYTKLKQIRNHGMEPRYYHKLIGGNFRMDALQAAVLNVKFPHLEAWHEARRRNAALYTRLFGEAGLAEVSPAKKACSSFEHCPNCANAPLKQFDECNTSLLPPALSADSKVSNHHIYNQYTLRVPRRDALRQYLAERGIGSEIYYPVPFHRQECFAGLGAKDDNFPVANCLVAHVISLPIYPELGEEQIRHVVESITLFYDN
jgi:dTDP-4-amino-4,6-dideoxygalactose transaminase